jgi:calcium-dependent protein kinase
VVRFYGFYQDESFYYLITEFCKGSDLLSKIEMLRTFSEKKAAHIIRQIFSAMVLCHSQNIVHRDLKPENILFEAESIESNVKVIDFGRSKILMPNQKIVERAGSVLFNIYVKISYFTWHLKYYNAKNTMRVVIYGVLE